ncbi:hypothetical protein F5Y14DRAFT_465222 [Nemania sp. NC0429]|nr:hypothetical protein F5Y14DRAFT_465222 [Nemania sp. NC0429]
MEISIGLVTVETVSTLALLLITIILVVAVALGVHRINYAAANDWARFRPSVMGEWAVHQKRRFRWLGLRWEIEYQTPFVSLGAMDEVDSLVEGPAIYFINGNRSDLQDINVEEANAESKKAVVSGIQNDRMVAPRDERVSWVQLLATVQSMESESASWEAQKWLLDDYQDDHIHEDVAKLAVGIQHLRRVYRQVLPTKLPKPYAAITVAHLVGLAAMLGMNWKEFDQAADIYVARGNGLILRGRRSPMGVVFAFEQTGPCHFRETRVIPTTEINELCFGHVPTFFLDNKLNAEEELQATLRQRALKTLQLGSLRDIANTLRLIGCNAATARYYLEGGRTAHVFPVVFEVIGMLGRNLHLPDRYFTFLPNPTSFPLDKRNFSLGRLLREFVTQMDMLGGSPPYEIVRIHNMARSLLQKPALHSWRCYPPELMSELHEAIFDLDNILMQSKASEHLVVEVARLHLEATHAFINGATIGSKGGSPDAASSETSIDDLSNCSPREAEKRLMRVYFEKIQPVATTISESFFESWVDHNPEQSADNHESEEGLKPTTQSCPKEGQAVIIWCALVLRMICWLSLHNFDKDDVQINKDGAMGTNCHQTSRNQAAKATAAEHHPFRLSHLHDQSIVKDIYNALLPPIPTPAHNTTSSNKTRKDKKMGPLSFSSADLLNFTIADSSNSTHQQPSNSTLTGYEGKISPYGIPGVLIGALLGWLTFELTHQIAKYCIRRRRMARAFARNQNWVVTSVHHREDRSSIFED